MRRSRARNLLRRSVDDSMREALRRAAIVGSLISGTVILATAGFGLVRRLISAEAASNTCGSVRATVVDASAEGPHFRRQNTEDRC
jgi:hypothetical protein